MVRPKLVRAVLSCGVLFCLALPFAASSQSTVEGIWVNGDGDGWIELAITDGELRGRITGSPDDPDNQKPSRTDVQNPDVTLRNRPLRGLLILTGFRADDSGRWIGGRVYDPNSGNTYRGTITQVGEDTLKLRGYIGISWFGRTEIWNRRPENL